MFPVYEYQYDHNLSVGFVDYLLMPYWVRVLQVSWVWVSLFFS